MDGTCGEHRGTENACRVLEGKLDENGPLGRRQSWGEDIIKKYLEEVRLEVVD
jgi:hypothetical protein